MKRKYVVLAVGVTVVACAIATACGDDDTGSGATPDAGNGVETSAPDTSMPDTDGGAEGSLVDQASPGDDAEAGGRDGAPKPDAEANCVSVDKCDCDNDGYRSGTQTCRLDGGSDANTDCDDLDPVVYPAANRPYFSDPNPPRGGDVNCSGKVEKQYNVNLACGISLPCGGEGFLNDPPCGTSAPYYKCGGLAVCGPQAAGMRTQGCL